MIDRVQEFWDRQPCNIRHSPKEVGTREYFDEVEARKYFVEPHIPKFAQFERWKGKRVLEIGCGIGTDTVNFARAGANVTAVELSRRSLELCEERVGLFGLQDRVNFVLADCEHLSEYLPPQSYDLVYSFGVLHHTPNPKVAIQEIAKYLSVTSELRLMLYATVSVKNLGIVLRWVSCEAQLGVPVAYTYTKKGLRRLLTGFRIVSARKDHIFPWRVLDYVEYRYKKMWYWRFVPRRLFRSLEYLFGWHWLVVAVLER